MFFSVLCLWEAFWNPNPSPGLTVFLCLGSLFGSFLVRIFFCEPALVSAILGCPKCVFLGVRGHGAFLCICGVGCYISIATFNCKSELVSVICWSPKCLLFRGWDVVQFCVFEVLVAHLRMECTFEGPKRNSEPEFCLSGCSGKLNLKLHQCQSFMNLKLQQSQVSESSICRNLTFQKPQVSEISSFGTSSLRNLKFQESQASESQASESQVSEILSFRILKVQKSQVAEISSFRISSFRNLKVQKSQVT